MGRQLGLFPEDKFVVFEELELEKAQGLADLVKAKVEGLCVQIEVVGSIRRRKAKVHDVDFVVVTPSDAAWDKVNVELKRLKARPNCSGRAVIKAYLPVEGGYFQVDFYRATPATFGIHKLARTGSAEHNIWLAQYAATKGLKLQYSQGVIKDGTPIAGATENEIFQALNLPYSEPCEREIVDRKPLWQK